MELLQLERQFSIEEVGSRFLIWVRIKHRGLMVSLCNFLDNFGRQSRWVGWIKKILYSSKASILVNGAPIGYIRYQRGLRQGDPLSPLLFVLVTDVLSSMFALALTSKILVGVPLGVFGSKCNLHYADDLLILTSGWLEDLRIIKLIPYLFEDMSGLEMNFSKKCLFKSNGRALRSCGRATL